MNKKHAAKKLTGILAGLLSAVILFGELSLGVLANFEVKVSAGSAKIRASADTTSNVLASVKSGDKLDAIEEVTGSDGSTWYKVNIDANTKGYIRSDLVSKTSGSSSSSTSTTTTTTTTTTTATTAAEPAPTTTDVTAIAAQSATVTSNTVNVRKQASTSAAAVAKLNKGAVVTATGTAKGSDGKTWYQVTFINNGSEVTGFIREDLMQLGEAAAPTTADSAEAGEAAVGEEPAAEETAPVEAEPEPVQTPAPVLPEGVKNYELKYTEGTDGATDWYVYNNTDGYRMKLDELIQAQATSQSNQKKFEKQAGTLRLVLIILAILFAAALTAAVIFFLKYRSELYEYDDEDEDDYDEDDEDEEDEDEDEEEDEDDDVKIAPSRNARPAHPQGAAAHQGRPAAPGAARPAGQGARPAGQGQRPAGQGQRPAGQGQRPAGQGQRPAGQGQRPAGAAPAGQQRPRPENGAHAAGNGRNVTPAQTRRPAPGEGAQGAGKKNEMPWKSKNFLNEDEDLDFSFIDDADLN